MEHAMVWGCAAFAALAACAPTPQSVSCPFTGDGVCDEPRNCPLGTDESDCAAVCQQDPDLAPIACSYRGAPSPPTAPSLATPDVGSNGSGGLVGTWDGNLQANGPDGASGPLITRYFRLYVPASYDPSRPAPVLYAMGGNQVSMYTWESFTDLERTADQNGFILAFLEADWRYVTSDISLPVQQWNWVWYVYATGLYPGGGGEWTLPSGATYGSAEDWAADPDVDFVRRVTAQIESLYNVDRTRIFASGHSRGAALSIILAYELPDLIAGYCEQSGFASAQYGNDFTPQMAAYTGSRKIPGVVVHGMADQDVPFSESVAIVQTLTAAGYVEGQDFLYYPLAGVTHHWQSYLNQEMWDFLSAHPLPLSMVSQ